MSVTTYKDYIEDGWLALAAAIISPKELTVNECLHLIGINTVGMKVESKEVDKTQIA